MTISSLRLWQSECPEIMGLGFDERRVPLNTDGKNSFEDSSINLPPEAIIFGSSEAMQAVRQALEKVVDTSAPVLIVGETGTGKEVLARLIHSKSPWGAAPFFKINCPVLRGSLAGSDPFDLAAISRNLPEAVEIGKGPLSGQGTLFLNEIALLDPALQVRLLERLQQGSPIRISLPDGNSLELRVICATSYQLEREVEAGNFLRKLWYLLKVVTLELPPLRERRDDIPELTAYFLDYYNRKFQTWMPPPAQSIMDLVIPQSWPGNIRELENLIMRYVIQGAEETFVTELRNPISPGSPVRAPSKGSASLKQIARQAVEETERRIIRQVLENHHWNRKEAARALNISYRAFLYKIKDAGVPPKRNKRPTRSSM